MENVDSNEVRLPLWYFRTRQPSSITRYNSIESAGQDIEYLNTAWSQKRDEQDPPVMIDSLGRRVFMEIEQADVLVCRLETLEPTPDDLAWLERTKAGKYETGW